MPPPENTWYSDYGSCGLEAVSALTHELKTTVGCTLVKNYPKPERNRAQKTIVQHAAAERRADLVRRFVGDEFLSSDDTERMKWTWTHAIESAIFTTKLISYESFWAQMPRKFLHALSRKRDAI